MSSLFYNLLQKIYIILMISYIYTVLKKRGRDVSEVEILRFALDQTVQGFAQNDIKTFNVQR